MPGLTFCFSTWRECLSSSTPCKGSDRFWRLPFSEATSLDLRFFTSASAIFSFDSTSDSVCRVCACARVCVHMCYERGECHKIHMYAYKLMYVRTCMEHKLHLYTYTTTYIRSLLPLPPSPPVTTDSRLHTVV